MQTKPNESVIGIIGGSGIYEIDGLDNPRWITVTSAFGEPSDQLLTGRLHGQAMAFLPRHGRGHKLPPSEVNYRANIDALKKIGVTDVISLSAVGSLKADLAPGTFVIVDQFIDRTFARENPFSVKAWWRMCQWRIRSAPALATICRMRQQPLACPSCAVAPIWRWRGHNFPVWPNPVCISNGAATSLA